MYYTHNSRCIIYKLLVLCRSLPGLDPEHGPGGREAADLPRPALLQVAQEVADAAGLPPGRGSTVEVDEDLLPAPAVPAHEVLPGGAGGHRGPLLVAGIRQAEGIWRADAAVDAATQHHGGDKAGPVPGVDVRGLVVGGGPEREAAARQRHAEVRCHRRLEALHLAVRSRQRGLVHADGLLDPGSRNSCKQYRIITTTSEPQLFNEFSDVASRSSAEVLVSRRPAPASPPPGG